MSTSALTSDVTKITVSISGFRLTTPMTTQLTKAQDGIQWTGHITKAFRPARMVCSARKRLMAPTLRFIRVHVLQ